MSIVRVGNVRPPSLAMNAWSGDGPMRCYGYGIEANLAGKATLGAEWRQYEAMLPALAASRIGQVSVECRNAKVPMRLLSLLDGKDVLVGVIDVATNHVE